jgi:hypothetical protein
MLESRKAMTSARDSLNEEKNFGEFLRKVKSAEVLSALMEHLLLSLGFTGRVSVVMQNGRVLKSGYEEGYFHQRQGRRIGRRERAQTVEVEEVGDEQKRMRQRWGIFIGLHKD